MIRRRAVRLLMDTAVPALRPALRLERGMFKAFLSKQREDKYTAGITRLAFGLDVSQHLCALYGC